MHGHLFFSLRTNRKQAETFPGRWFILIHSEYNYTRSFANISNAVNCLDLF